jgi:SAM-dependent methyltransferase
MSADTVPGGENRGVREQREPAESRLQPGLAAPQVQRELAYHEKLYSGFAQAHFARPAVRALRAHMAQRILRITGAGASSRVLSLGCGIGDTELLLAPHVREIVGVDLSPAAIRQARADAERLGIRNARFYVGSNEGSDAGNGVGSDAPARYDAVIAIFFLHHLADAALAELPWKIRERLEPGGVFYSLDPSRDRLSGVVGRKLIPGLMKKYQSPDERELDAEAIAGLFRRAGFETRIEVYDFGSSPLAGLLPGWRFGYRVARALDDVLLKSAALRRRGSNFELIAR